MSVKESRRERGGAVPKRVTLPGGARLAIEPSEPGVVVTGICGRLGRRVCRLVHRETRVVGIDRRPFPEQPKDV